MCMIQQNVSQQARIDQVCYTKNKPVFGGRGGGTINSGPSV
jgi:hypothetical protein